MSCFKIAMFVAKFDPTLKNPWLIDELSEALGSQGHIVDVFFLDWYREYTESIITINENIHIHIVAPFGGKSNLVSKLLHWTLSSFRVYKYYQSHFNADDHNLLIVFSPSIVFCIALLKLRSAFKNRILIQWDFFPYHQEQIGLIPFRWITKVGAVMESTLLSTFTFIGCMSQRNVDYLTHRYRLAPNVQTGIVPLWAKIRDKPNVDKAQIRKQFDLPQSTPIAVFGGQIAPGRGIEDVVAAAELAAETDAPIHFLFIGKGSKLEWLIEKSLLGNAKFTVLPHVSRDKYLELISCCDAGIVATIREVDVPTFPSKTLDYCCAGLPVIASVERSTDYGEIISSFGIGLSCEAGESTQLLALCLQIFADGQTWERFSKQSRRFYEEKCDVQKITSDLISMMGSHKG